MSELYKLDPDGPKITVKEMVETPQFIPDAILGGVKAKFVDELIFRDGGANGGAIAYHEYTSPYLSQGSEAVAQLAEIPVAEPLRGAFRTKVGTKQALAVRVSYEMIHNNQLDEVNKRVTALTRTMIRDAHMAVWHVLEAAPIPTLDKSTNWGKDTGKPLDDVLRAIETIQSAKHEGNQLGFNPDTLLISRTDLTRLNRHDSVQAIYRGDLASENPLYKGLVSSPIPGINVAVSSYIPAGAAYVLESGTLGMRSDTLPFTVTPMYQEGGNSGAGGPNMSYRTDAFRQRILAVDAPQAAVKIETAKG